MMKIRPNTISVRPDLPSPTPLPPSPEAEEQESTSTSSNAPPSSSNTVPLYTEAESLAPAAETAANSSPSSSSSSTRFPPPFTPTPAVPAVNDSLSSSPTPYSDLPPFDPLTISTARVTDNTSTTPGMIGAPAPNWGPRRRQSGTYMHTVFDALQDDEIRRGAPPIHTALEMGSPNGNNAMVAYDEETNRKLFVVYRSRLRKTYLFPVFTWVPSFGLILYYAISAREKGAYTWAAVAVWVALLLATFVAYRMKFKRLKKINSLGLLQNLPEDELNDVVMNGATLRTPPPYSMDDEPLPMYGGDSCPRRAGSMRSTRTGRSLGLSRWWASSGAPRADVEEIRVDASSQHRQQQQRQNTDPTLTTITAPDDAPQLYTATATAPPSQQPDGLPPYDTPLTSSSSPHTTTTHTTFTATTTPATIPARASCRDIAPAALV
ncbi:hypothetical protein DFJ77DRAFT_550849 [Powellomyces hirtus]|nr:hypothetical protein DFJ77DRAFT_550849 [Powellomyces hirtus]